MAKDINKQPYDEATLTKLEIFEQYLIAWLPVFIQAPHTRRVIICDYFAGSGRDSEGTAGSPLRILRTIETYRDSIHQKDFSVDVILNEAIRDKLQELQHAVNDSFNLASWDSKVAISFENEKFLDVVWGENNINGEANFDIDRDRPKKEPSLFDSLSDYERPLTKRDSYERDLEAFIREKDVTTNREVYEFTLEHGHPKSHARACVVRLKKEGKVEYVGNIGFSYASCIKKDPKPIKAVNHG